jgi:hypothetical protein
MTAELEWGGEEGVEYTIDFPLRIQQIIRRIIYDIDNYMLNYMSAIEAKWSGQLNTSEIHENIIQYENSLIPVLNIPSVIFDSSDTDFIASVPGFHNECSICIEQVTDKELVKRLPKCGHMYHAKCIDTWLDKNNICPVCRVNLS